MRYRMRPVDPSFVDAFQLYVDDTPCWFSKYVKLGKITILERAVEYCEITTSYGKQIANKGDYIIKTEDENIYSINEKEFHRTYERINPNRDYAIGDHVRIIAKKNGHHFLVGDEVKIVSITSDRNRYLASFNGDERYWVAKDEIEPH